MGKASDYYRRLEILGALHNLKKNKIDVPMKFFDKPKPIKEIIKFLRDEKGFTFEKIGKIFDKTPSAVFNIYISKRK